MALSDLGELKQWYRTVIYIYIESYTKGLEACKGWQKRSLCGMFLYQKRNVLSSEPNAYTHFCSLRSSSYTMMKF